MSETLRDLVVSLSLNSDNFTRNIKSINKQIQEAESAFRLASAGVENFETTPVISHVYLSMRCTRQMSYEIYANKRIKQSPFVGKITCQLSEKA